MAVAVIAAALFSYSALAAVPASQPSIVNTNATTINGVQIANASITRATDNLFTSINFSSDILTCVRSLPSLCSASNASLEENSMSEIRDFRASSEAKKLLRRSSGSSEPFTSRRTAHMMWWNYE